ncbi:MAG: extracellular solute-binding protein [Oscillospiraceae bacterium]|nr:extracellular solute-binding protein [Oscillospiraceae bacterium]
MKNKLFGDNKFGNRLLQRSLSLMLALAMMVPFVGTVYADSDTSEEEETSTSTTTTVAETSAQAIDDASRENSYSTFYDNHADDPRPDAEIEIAGTDYSYVSEDSEAYVDTIDGVEALVLPEEEATVEYTFTVEEAGIYNIEIMYYALASTANDIELAVYVDGELPYSTAERILLDKIWVISEDSYEYDEDGNRSFRTDSTGNQVRPTLEESLGWQTTYFEDTDGLYNDPLEFYFSEGEHTITIVSDKARFAISYLKICNEEDVASLTEVDTVTTDVSVASETTGIYIQIEGEDCTSTSDITIYPTQDRSTYLTSPQASSKQVYNTIGSETWKDSGMSVTWTFTMEESGWVKIGIRAIQDEMRGLFSNRTIYIDGEIPCEEAEAVKFYYSNSWSVTTPTDEDGNTIYFYLEAGEHTITLEAVPGDIGEIMRELDDLVYYLNSYYRQILMITGSDPDEYTDYMVHKQIPDLLEDFQTYADELRALKSKIEEIAGTSGTEAVSLETMAQLLDKMIARPDDIPAKLDQFKDDVTALSQWMTDYRSQYLEVDFIEITSADVEFTSTKENFFQQLKFSWDQFIASFFEDYNNLSDGGEDALEVWVSLGRDQAQIVKELIDSYFVEETGIEVNVSLVQGGIIEATLAGKGPDVALFVSGDLPLQLAIRDCLVDVSQFDDYEEVIERFSDNVMTLYTYSDEVFGLPISQTFSMMFYRTDVLSSFGFESAPETWDELIDMLPTIQRSYMNVGFNFDAYATFMVQNGMDYYNSSKTATTFSDITAVECFEMWTEFYTLYSFEQTFDQFSRFRTGEYPIIITGYTFYNQVYTAAPEIRGLWDFALVPGTVQEDGSINHATTSTTTGAVIFSKLSEEQQEDAWELIKWFTSSDIQAQYGRSLEALLGPLGRFDTANQEALTQLSWSKSEYTLILEQMNYTTEISLIPATYIVTRNITNAFREVVNNYSNARDTLLWYNRDINDEITRKYEELGIDISTLE